MDETMIYVYGYDTGSQIKDSNLKSKIHIYKDKNDKFYIKHNNKVINKNRPFDEIKLKTEYFRSDNRFACRAGDIWDIYEKYDKFKFNAINISGKNEKPWFDN